MRWPAWIKDVAVGVVEYGTTHDKPNGVDGEEKFAQHFCSGSLDFRGGKSITMRCNCAKRFDHLNGIYSRLTSSCNPECAAVAV